MSFRLTFLKKFVFLLLITESVCIPAFANPGDTTWVTVWNLRKLTQYGNYDTTATFPVNKRYRKIRMHYVLGRYVCPGNPQYCGSWDYTTQIYARPAGKDSVEIARVITPYATDWLSQGRKHDYVVDITDYASALEGPTAMRFNYSGYSWGFTITLKLEFIEGVPPMDALSVKNIYDGYYTYGNAANSIENYLTAKTFSYGAATGKAFIKNSVSGHGSDANYCGEFCSKYYRLNINNAQVAQKQLWRNDCGTNEVYPQTGTWVYDRANWCPGAVVWPIYHDISALTSANTNFTVDVDMETYTVTNPSGGYNWVSQFIQYSTPNHSLDISIEDVISPNNDPNYYRENPTCMNPVVKIKNEGVTPITLVVFNYGLQGASPLSYTWTGSLNFRDETQAVFPLSSAILSGTTSSVFQVSVVSVNGNLGDNNLYNNLYSTITKPVTVFPQDFVVKLFTNNSTDPNTQKNESSWTLHDGNGVLKASRSGLSNATVYIDTLRSLPAGCYKFTINDTGCDGLSWWANTTAGNGSMRLDYINANNTIYAFPVDIGCNFTLFFSVLPPPTNTTSIASNTGSSNHIEVYPNPARSTVFVRFDLTHRQDVEYYLTDLTGKELLRKSMGLIDSAYEPLALNGLEKGVYFLTANFENGTKLTKKIIIQ